MSGVPELQKADNGVFYIHWTEGRRSKRVSTKSRDLDGAKAFLGRWLVNGGQAAPETAVDSPLVSDLWKAYETRHIDAAVMSPDTAKYSWANLKTHFGALRVSAITADTVDAYAALRRSGAIGRPSADSTIRRELNALRACWNWCADPKRKLLTAASIPPFDLPAESAPRDRWLRLDELQRLLDAAASRRAGDRLSRGERFLWLALETSARKEALCQLTWDRVDFEIGVIDLNLPGRKVTKKRRAIVPISPSLLPILKRAHEERRNNHVLDNEADVWRIVAGIAKAAGVEGVSPHVLRHTAATQMARRGVPLWIIAKVLGNTLAMVEKVYAKHSPEDLRTAVGLISGGVLEAAE